jgi:hypothetical protein
MQLIDKLKRLLLIVPVLLYAGTAASATPVEVYRSDFVRGAGEEWSKTKIETSPKGMRTFLGQFGKEQLELRLKSLPAHESVTITFDLYIMNSWDGNAKGTGPDTWGLSVKDGTTLLHTTFSNCPGQNQSYPGRYPGDNNPAYKGAVARGVLGYDNQGNTIYHLTYTIPHASDDITFTFTGGCNEPLWNESWGLNNVAVSVEPVGPHIVPMVSSGNIVVQKGDILKVTGKPGVDFTKMVQLKVDGPAVAKQAGGGAFELCWDTKGVNLGLHDIQVEAVTGTGRATVMQANVNVIDSAPIKIITPTANIPVTIPVDVKTVDIKTEPAKGLILQKLELFVDGKSITSSDKPILKLDPSKLPSGLHEMSVVAYTQAGNALSRPLAILVPDRIKIVQDTPQGTNIQINSASDKLTFHPVITPGLKASTLSLLYDKYNAKYKINPAGTSIEVELADAPSADCRFALRLKDQFGNTYDSEPVNIRLDNAYARRKAAEEAERQAAARWNAKLFNVPAYMMGDTSKIFEVVSIINTDLGWALTLRISNTTRSVIKCSNIAMKLQFNDYTEKYFDACHDLEGVESIITPSGFIELVKNGRKFEARISWEELNSMITPPGKGYDLLFEEWPTRKKSNARPLRCKIIYARDNIFYAPVPPP